MGPRPPSAHLLPRLDLDVVRACLITQLAAPRPPEAGSPPPAAWPCQELTGAVSKHPRAPAQGSALAIRALLGGPAEAPRWGLERSQQGGEGTNQASGVRRQVGG